MASEPKWEKWRRMDSARLWQLVALLDRREPDSIVIGDESVLTFHNTGLGFEDILAIAESGVAAGTLSCLDAGSTAHSMRTVLMSEFLRWAQSKGLSIPPELKPPEGTGPTSTGAAASSQIKGTKEFMKFCEVRGLVFGSERAARAFIENAEIKPIDEHAKKGRRVYDAAAVEPKVLAESARRKNWPK
jgi:hypothetical protein